MLTIRRSVMIFALALVTLFPIASSHVFAQHESSVCQLSPLALPLFDGMPPAIVASTPLPQVEAISEDAIRSAIAGIVACINSGEPQRMFAIFTTRYLAEQFADPTRTYLPELEQRLARNLPEPSGQFTLVEVRNIALMVDGRVKATVVLASTTATYRDSLILANQNGIWLIDGVARFDPPL